MARRKKTIKLQVPMPPGYPTTITVWQALNEPIAYPTTEFTKTFFPVAIFMFLSIAAIPYFRNTTGDYYRYGSVAGVSTEMSASETPQWYNDLKSTTASLGEFYQENVAAPFGEATSDILDVSEPVINAKEFLAPGARAVKDEWLYLMQDPY